jgi:hypothetical protein
MAINVGNVAIEISADASKFRRGMADAVGTARKAGDDISASMRLAKQALGALSAGLVVNEIKKIIAVAEESILVQKRLEAVYRATGGTVGFTTRELHKLADAMAASTSFDDESIRNGMASLIKFGNIHGKVFADALKLTADYAAFAGTDFASAAEAMGRALADADSASRLLRTMGVAPLTEAQRSLINELQAAGREEEAQMVILDKLRGSFEGVDKALNSGLTGSVNNLKKAWDELLETVGKTDSVTGGTNSLAEYLRAIKLVIEDGDWFEKLRFFTIGNLSERLTTKLRTPPPKIETAGKDPDALAREKAAKEQRALDAEIALGEQNLAWLRKEEEKDRVKITAAIQKQKAAVEALGEADQSRMQKLLEFDEKTIEQSRQLLEQQDQAIDALAREVAGWNDLSESQRVSWEIQTGRYKDFDAQTKEELVRLAEILDARREEEKTMQRMADLQEKANKNFSDAQDKYLREVQEQKDAQLKVWESIEKTAHDTFVSIFDSGKSAFDRLRDTLKNGLLDLLYQMTLKKWIISISAAVTGGTAGTAAAELAGAASGGTSGLGLLGTAKAAWNVFTSGFSAANDLFLGGIYDFGASVADLGGIFADIGGWIGTNGAMLANIAPFASSFISLLTGDIKGAISSGIGAGIGLALGGPVGGMIGSALGSLVGGLFGDTKNPRAKIKYSLGADFSQTNITAWSKDGGKLSEAQKLVDAQIALFRKTIEALNIELIEAVTLSSKYSSNGFRFKYFNTETGEQVDSGRVGKKGIDNAMAFVQLGALIGEKLLPQWLEDIAKGLKSSKKTGVEDLNFIIGVKQLHDALGALPPEFAKLQVALEKMISKTNIEKFQSLTSAAATFYSLFYTEQEKYDFALSQLNKAYGELNLALPESREAYRALVESIDVSTQSGLDLYGTLLALAPSMDAYYKALEQQKSALDGLVLSMDKFATLADYTRAVSYQKQGIDIAKLPSYDTGTPFVPVTGPALIHRGEAVLTANENRQRGLNMQSVVDGLRRLEQKVEAGLMAVASSTADTAKRIRQWDGDGMPATRTV